MHKIDPTDMSEVETFEADGNVISLAYGSDGFLYAGTTDNKVYKIATFDIPAQLDIRGVAPVSDLKDYQVMLITNDGTEVRRTFDTADAFLQVDVSSRRFKRDITDVEDAAQKLYNIATAQFSYRGNRDDGRTHYGVIAEELAQIMPELVRYDNNGQPERVRYIEMVPLLVDALQKVKAENKELHGYVEQQSERLHEQKEQIQDLYRLIGQMCSA